MIGRTAFIVVALAALFLAGCTSIAPPEPQVGNINPVGVADWWGSWVGWTVMALLVSIFIVSIVYMAASLIRDAGLMAWCKVELYQIAMTAVIVGGLILFVYTIASVNTSVIGISCFVPVNPHTGDPADPSSWLPEDTAILEKGCNMFDFSMVYLKWLRQQTWVIYQRHLLIYQKYAFMTSITFGAALGGIGPVLQPMVWLQPVLNFTTLILNFITPALILIMLMIEVLRYVQFGMLNILLPIGVVCRSFGPLREFGGALMGMAIALFIFVPFTFVVNAAVMMPSYVVDPATGDVNPYYLDEILFENQLNDISTKIDEENLEDMELLVQKGVVDPAGDPWPDTKTGFNQWAGGTWYQIGVMLDGIWFGRLNFNISHVILGALILPILNFMIIVTAARELSRFLGEEVDVTNLTRMI